MTKRLIHVLVPALLLLGATLALAASNWYDTSGSASQTNTVVTFTDNVSGAAFKARTVCVWNDDAANSIYISLAGSAATTANHQLKFGDKWVCYNFNAIAGGDGWSRVDLICAGGLTAAYRVQAMR